MQIKPIIKRRIRCLLGSLLPAVLKPAYRKNCGWLGIVTYHDIIESGVSSSAATPDALELEKHLLIYKKYFQVLPLSEALRRLESGTLSKPSLAITFDDGGQSFGQTVLPLLRRHQVPAALFVCGSAARDRKPLWGEGLRELWRAGRQDYIARLLKQDSRSLPSLAEVNRIAQSRYTATLRDELVAIARNNINGGFPYHNLDELAKMPPELVEIGNHTWSHAPLAALDEAALRAEVGRNHECLRNLPGFSPVLAIPFGQSAHFRREQVLSIRREYGLYVCSSSGGVNRGWRPADYFRFGGEIAASDLKGHLVLQTMRRR